MKKTLLLGLSLACALPMTAQGLPDSTDMFFRHLELKEVMVTGAVGDMKMKESPMPISILQAKELHQLSSTNLMASVRKVSNGAMNMVWKSTAMTSARWRY